MSPKSPRSVSVVEPELERALRQFEAAWAKGVTPTFGDYLPQDLSPDHPNRLKMLCELIKIDLEMRFRAGRTPNAAPVGCYLLENYVRVYPELKAHGKLPLDLIAEEYRVRHRWRDKPAHAGYLRRFPEHAPYLETTLRRIDEELKAESPRNQAAAAYPSDMQSGVLNQDTLPPKVPSPPVDVHVQSTLPPAEQADACSSKPTTAHTAPLPDISGYEILSILGRGGMGVVYKARHLKLKRVVALKMIGVGAHASPDQLARFQAEAESSARLSHPNIVQIFEVGSHLGMPFIALEYVEGTSLDKKLAGTPQNPKAAAQLVRTLAEAMHHAHAQGIVHRDLKPANVLLSGPLTTDNWQLTTTPKITDFGLAKQLDSTEGQTHTGAILGTPSYMAPEQAEGKTKQIGPATDIYALGAILYELLTGRAPFKGETPMETVMQVIADEPVPPASLQTKVPKDVETICLKCLQKEPGKRYASAGGLADELRRFLIGEPIQARPVKTAEQLWRWCKRRPSLAIASGAAILGLLATLMTFVVAFFVVSAARDDAIRYAKERDDQRIEAEKGAEVNKVLAVKEKKAREQADERRRESEKMAMQARLDHLYLHAKEQPHVAMIKGAELFAECVLLKNEDLVDSVTRHFVSWSREVHPLRAIFSHNYPVLSDAFTLRRPRVVTNPVSAVAFSPNGKIVLTASHDGTARFWNAVTGEPVGSPLQHSSKIRAVAFSGNGKTVVTASLDKTARIWESPTGKSLGPPLIHGQAVIAVAFSPDGSRVLTGSADKTARLWNAATGEPIGSPLIHLDSVAAVAISPDNKMILTGSYDRTARLWENETCKPLGKPLTHEGEVVAVAFSPDSNSVLTGSGDKTARLWEVSTGKLIVPVLLHEAPIVAVAFSPYGRTIATGSYDRTARLWEKATGKPVGVPLRHLLEVTTVSFSPEGQRVLTGSYDGTARLWDSASGAPIGGPMHNNGSVYAAAFSPDGRYLVTGGADNTARLWEIAGPRLSGRSLEREDLILAMAFSADGKTALTGCIDNSARLWDCATGGPIGPPLTHQGPVFGAAFSPDGKIAITGSDDKTARLWDTATGKAVGQSLDHQDKVRFVAFGPDGKSVLTNSSNTWRLWDIRTSQARHLHFPDRVACVAFSPDGKILATGSDDKTARLWDAASGECLGTPLTHNQYVTAVAFSRDGSRILTGSGDKTARIWDSVSGKPVGPVLRHKLRVRAVAFSPDGTSVLTGSDDLTAQLWDCPTGKLLGPPLQHRAEVIYVGFSSDGRVALTASRDRTARLWEVPTGKQLGLPLQYPALFSTATFGSDRATLLTEGIDGTARMLQFCQKRGDAKQIVLWAQVKTGLKLNERGDAQVLDGVNWQLCRQQLEALGDPLAK